MNIMNIILNNFMLNIMNIMNILLNNVYSVTYLQVFEFGASLENALESLIVHANTAFQGELVEVPALGNLHQTLWGQG